MFHYKTKAGVFWIRRRPVANEGYWLGIDDTVIGMYVSPMLAADDVAMHATGWDAWDDLDGEVEPPHDISEWRKVSE